MKSKSVKILAVLMSAMMTLALSGMTALANDGDVDEGTVAPVTAAGDDGADEEIGGEVEDVDGEDLGDVEEAPEDVDGEPEEPVEGELDGEPVEEDLDDVPAEEEGDLDTEPEEPVEENNTAVDTPAPVKERPVGNPKTGDVSANVAIAIASAAVVAIAGAAVIAKKKN